MKISTIEVFGFGKLEDLTLDLSDNLNIIYSANEGGKSTLESFIKSLFYGLVRQDIKAVRADKDKLDKYRPWHGGPFGGRMVYDDGANYEISYNFARNEGSFSHKGSFFSIEDPRELGKSIFGFGPELYEELISLGENLDLKREMIGDYIFSSFRDGKKLDVDGLISQLERENSRIGTDRISAKKIGELNKSIEDCKNILVKLPDRRDFENLGQKILTVEDELRFFKNISIYLEEEPKVSFKGSTDELEHLESCLETKPIHNFKAYLLSLVLCLALSALASLFSGRILGLSLMALGLGALGVFIILAQKRGGDNRSHDLEEAERILNSHGLDSIDQYRLELRLAQNFLVGRKKYYCPIEGLDLDDPLYNKALIEEKLGELEKQLIVLGYERERMAEKLDKRRNLLEKLDSLEKEKEDLQLEFQVNELIMASLLKAKLETGRAIRRDLEESMSNYIDYLSQGKYDYIHLKDDLSAYVSDGGGGLVSISRLSSGTIQIMEIAFKLAVRDLGLGEANFPLILDDFGSHLDAKRRSRLLELLVQYSRNYQLIFFTKDDRILNMIDLKKGDKYFELE